MPHLHADGSSRVLISATWFANWRSSAQDLSSIGTESAVPGLNRNLAYMNKQIAPTEDVVEQFGIYVSHIFAHRHCVNTESMVLASLRDTLLPQLISGELGVTDASRAEATH